jgi:protein arginine kinase activator
MKCQKCAKPAVVHLTEVVTDADDGRKRAVEIHLCLHHGVEAGLVVAGPEVQAAGVPQAGLKEAATPEPQTAIVPAAAEAGALTVTRGPKPADPSACPICGVDWNAFKQAGLMGCPHDYELFGAKMLPLLKRAQEGATEHVGKVPPRKKTQETERQVVTLRLRRELQKAVDAENYEAAAQLRDQLRRMEKN